MSEGLARAQELECLKKLVEAVPEDVNRFLVPCLCAESAEEPGSVAVVFGPGRSVLDACVVSARVKPHPLIGVRRARDLACRGADSRYLHMFGRSACRVTPLRTTTETQLPTFPST